MTVWRTLVLDTPEARLLAEAEGVVEDLRWTGEACREIVSLWEHYQEARRAQGPGSPSLLIEALTIAALIRYARAFKSGVRPKIATDALERLDSEQRRAHDYFVALRDKHFAHSVNPFEENRTTVLVPEPIPEDYRVSSLGKGHTRLGGFTQQVAEDLDRLSAKVADLVKDHLSGLRDEVLGAATELGAHELAELEEPVAPIFLGKDVGRRRPG